MHHFASGQDEHIEDVVQERDFRRYFPLAIILEEVEGGFAGLIEKC